MNLNSRVSRLEESMNPLGKNPAITVILDDIGGQPIAEEIEVARQKAIREGRTVCIVEGRRED